MQAEIHIERPRAWFGFFRSLKVLVDARPVARLRRGDSVTLTVDPGSHTLQVAMDWCSSPVTELRLERGGEAHFECVMPAAWKRVPFVPPAEVFQLVRVA